MRADWEVIKVDMMFNLVYDKFSKNPYLRDLLLLTKDFELEEGNNWGDTFWGVCDGVGENHLGKILMDVRTYLSHKV